MLWYTVHSVVYTCDLILARIWLLGLCPFINRVLQYGKRISDTWSSEIQKYAYGVMFQSLVFQRFDKLKKTKGLGRILPSGRRFPHHQLQSLSSELQNLSWFRSVDLGFGCCGLWFEFRVLGEFLLEFVELGFRITFGFKSLFRARFKVEVILYSCADCF